MAPALTSNSFRLTTGSYLKNSSKPQKPTAVVHAKQNPFGLGKRKGDSAEGGEAGDEGSNKGNRFFFDIGKIADAKSLIPAVSSPSTPLFANRRRKDPRTVFVAGASGQVGVRIAQMLLRRGFVVRAGVPELASAQELARLAAAYKIISPEESKRLNAVESTFGDSESIAKAIGPATKVVVTIGPGENGPAAEVTTDDALQVVRAAQLAGVGHVTVVCDSRPGASVGASSYNVLDGITSFFSNLFTRSQPLTLGEFLSKVVVTDVSYTLIKAALIDDYSPETSYGLVVSQEGTTTNLAGTPNYSKVSKSQIAALVADVFSNTSVAENKVVEVSTSPAASSKPVVELFSAIPEDGRRKAYAESVAKAKAEEEALKARKAAEAAKKVEAEVKKLSEQKVEAASLAEEAQERAAAAAAAAGSSLESFISSAKNFSGGFSWGSLSSQAAAIVPQKANDEAWTQIATIRGQVKARNLSPKKAVVKQAAARTKSKQPEVKPEVQTLFGGLFKQETIYIDDD